MTNIRTSNGETSISEETFNRAAAAITEDKHGPGWIKRVAHVAGLMPRVILAVVTRMQQREEAIRRREGLATSASPVFPEGQATTLPATENKPGTTAPDSGPRTGEIWS